MEQLTFDKLKNKVWEAADILRGSIDSADYKNYIFGMLFLKRLSDVFEEEAEKIEQETGDKELEEKKQRISESLDSKSGNNKETEE